MAHPVHARPHNRTREWRPRETVRCGSDSQDKWPNVLAAQPRAAIVPFSTRLPSPLVGWSGALGIALLRRYQVSRATHAAFTIEPNDPPFGRNRVTIHGLPHGARLRAPESCGRNVHSAWRSHLGSHDQFRIAKHDCCVPFGELHVLEDPHPNARRARRQHQNSDCR